MSYTNPSGLPQGKAHLFTNKIREAMIGELVAINGYYEHILNSNMIDINRVWEHIMHEEEEHYDMLITLVRKYDPGEYQKYLEIKDKQINIRPMQTYKSEYDKQIILNNIRTDIKGELEAIILYEHINGEMPYQDIKDTVNKIILDEKEHTEELTSVMLNYENGNINTNI